MRKYINLIVLSLFALAISSCKKDKYEAEKSNTVNMAGRWWVQLFGDSDDDGIPTESELIMTYEDFGAFGLVTSNTAANTGDSIIVDDPEHSWPFRMKAPVNYSNLTIAPSTNLNLETSYIGSGETVRVVEGKILKDAATLPSGRLGDSIFIKLEFSDDLGTFYIYSGHRDSGQQEDQH